MSSFQQLIMSETRQAIPSYFILFFGVMATIVPLAIDAYLPALKVMASDFGVTEPQMSWTISIFLLGYGLGQFFGGPISDQIGRKTMALTGMSIFVIASLGIAYSSTFEQIFALRFVQAIGGGFTSVIGMAAIRDVYPAHEAGRKYAVVIMIMLVMPLVAPFFGAFLLDLGWQYIFISMAIFVCLTAIWMWRGIPETRVVDQKRVQFKKIKSQFIAVLGTKSAEKKPAILYSVCMAFTAGVLLIFVNNSSYLYTGYFDVAEEDFPFYFGANVLLMVCTVYYSMRRMKKVHPHRLFIVGNLIQLIFTLCFLCYVIFFTPQLGIVLTFMVLMVGSMGLASPNASAVYISHFDELSGSATSFNNMLVLIVGGLTGGLVAFFLGDSILPIAVGMAICSALSNMIGWSIPAPQHPFKK